MDPFDNNIDDDCYVTFPDYEPHEDPPSKPVKQTKQVTIDPTSFSKDPKFPPIATPEQEALIKHIGALYGSPYFRHTSQNSTSVYLSGSGIEDGFDPEAAWIQTYSGRRFNPTNPNPEAIVIQDIAQALSMQCRFSGHCKEFYSVAQHSVLVSHICDSDDALWGLLHDASEAYLVDVPRPLKQSGQFQAYIDFEHTMQQAVCKRFGLKAKEPKSVKRADQSLLSTEARDLMGPLHPDWKNPVEPLPFRIEGWDQKKAKNMFMKRFFELTGNPEHYQHYLDWEQNKSKGL